MHTLLIWQEFLPTLFPSTAEQSPGLPSPNPWTPFAEGSEPDCWTDQGYRGRSAPLDSISSQLPTAWLAIFWQWPPSLMTWPSSFWQTGNLRPSHCILKFLSKVFNTLLSTQGSHTGVYILSREVHLCRVSAKIVKNFNSSDFAKILRSFWGLLWGLLIESKS